MKKKNPRRMPRRSVTLPGSADGVEGMMRDINPWGVFFAPQDKLDRQASDTVQLSLGHAAFVSAKVRWSGWSDKHSCFGLGLEYVTSPTSAGPKPLQGVK